MKIVFFRDKADAPGWGENPSRREELSQISHFGLTPEKSFRRLLRMERKRAERSKERFVLMLLDLGKVIRSGERNKIRQRTFEALQSFMRETDIMGWYNGNSIIGVIFTELGPADPPSIQNAIQTKVRRALQTKLDPDEIERVHISFHWFPENWDKQKPGSWSDLTLYPDLSEKDLSKRFSVILKRMMDIVGSLVALLVFSPLFILIAFMVKLCSRGSILFQQERVGQHGIKFTILKFRSMYLNNDPKIHKEYVSQFISGTVNPAGVRESRKPVYKLKRDPRVTPVGRLLRETSLDELPEFLNVLRGDMSLVGPRPPIPYEVEAYDVWHRRRLLEVKPGITGLWQVKGRSRTRFDEMVRLDLEYARTWSLWLDVKILLQTPWAVLSGAGAY